MADDKCKIRSRIEALRKDRQPEEDRWQDLADYVVPHRYRKYLESAKHEKRSRPEIVNERASLDLRTLGSGMMAGITSPSRPWFRLSVADTELADYQPVKEWLHEVQRRMSEQFGRSNLYNVLPTVYTDMGQFGTAAVAQLEDDVDAFRFYTFPICSYALGVSPRRVVDSFAYQTRMTVGSVVRAYGEENCSRRVQMAFKKGEVDQPVDVDVLIQPNEFYRPGSILAKDQMYGAWFSEKEGAKGQFLLESGFREFPVFTPRWESVDNDAYARDCPGMIALGSVRALQLEERTKLKAIEKQADPPLAAPSSMRSRLRSGRGLMPGGVVYEDMPTGMQGIRSVYDVRFDVAGVTADIRELEARIREAYFADLFLMLSMTDRRQMTAREVAERHEEKLMVLGPALERIHEELLDPLIDRTFNIMLRRGLLPEPPEELQNQQLKVEYISLLAQAQKMLGNGSIERYVGFVADAAQLDPSALDKFDADEAIDAYADGLGVPPKVNRSDEQVRTIREGRAAAQEREAQMAMAQEAAQGAKTLSETNTQDKNALTDLANQLRGGAL